MAMIAAAEGAIVGLIYAASAFATGQVPQVSQSEALLKGVVWGVIGSFFVGLFVGALAFMVAGVISCTSQFPQKVFRGALRLGLKASLLGLVLGAAIGVINGMVWNNAIQSTNLLRGWSVSGAFGEQGATAGCFWGLIIGFALSVWWGAIVGARRAQTAG